MCVWEAYRYILDAYNDREHYIYLSYIIDYTCNHGALRGEITPWIYDLYVDHYICNKGKTLFILFGDRWLEHTIIIMKNIYILEIHIYFIYVYYL